MPAKEYTKIVDYSDAELKEAVTDADKHLGKRGMDFFTVLKGVDAYMEQRKRKQGVNAYGERPHQLGD